MKSLQFKFGGWEKVGWNLMFMINSLVYGSLTLIAPFRSQSKVIVIAFMNITTVAIFCQLILSYILFGLMFIGNVLDKNTRLSDWLLLLFFFLNGILSRVFQNEWF